MSKIVAVWLLAVGASSVLFRVSILLYGPAAGSNWAGGLLLSLATVVLFGGGSGVIIAAARVRQVLTTWLLVAGTSMLLYSGGLVVVKIPPSTFHDPWCVYACTPTDTAGFLLLLASGLLFVGGTCLSVIAAMIASAVRG